MSENKRYCSHCGHVLDDNVRYCNNCGTPVLDEQSMSSKGSTARSSGTEEENFNVHVNWKLIVIIAVAVVVFIIVMASVSGTYRRPVKKLINAMETYNGKKLMDCFPQFYIDFTMEENDITHREMVDTWKEDVDEVQDNIDELLYSIDASNLNYSIEGVEDCDSGEIDSFKWDYIVPTFEVEFSEIPKIRDMKIVTVEITADEANGRGEADYSDEMLVCVGKIGLRWHVLSYSSDLW